MRETEQALGTRNSPHAATMVKKDVEFGLWGTLLVTAGAILLSWAAYEIAFLPILRPSRGAVDRSLDLKQGAPDDEGVETSKPEESEVREDSTAPSKQE